jgi:hypothetical protein
MHNQLRFCQLSPQRQALVRLCQSINYGYIQNLAITEQESVVAGDGLAALVDIRLDAEEQPRGELALPDFTLCAEVCRLMSVLDQVANGGISKIEVRAGIPRRILLESRLIGQGI